MKTDLFFSSKTDEWETPDPLFKALDAEFHFTLDACASPSNAKCFNYFTPENDGLSQPWIGVVWCNPPYGRQVQKWVEKAYKTAQAGDDDVVMLLFAKTDTKWFHEYVYGKAEIRFIRGRIKFGGCQNNAPFPSMIVIYRRKTHGDS